MTTHSNSLALFCFFFLQLTFLVNASSVFPGGLTEVVPRSSKQVLDFKVVTKTLYASRVCPTTGSCGDEVSETKPPATVAHEVCTSKCFVVTICGSPRAEDCNTKRDSSGKWISACRLLKCFDTVYKGVPTKCCTRQACTRPTTCTKIPAQTPDPIVIPVAPDPTGTIDLGVVPITATFILKKCLTIPKVAEDIYLLTDATGSMAGLIAEVKKNLLGIVNTRRSKVDDLRMGVGIYRDELELTDGFQNLLSLVDTASASNVNLLQSKINGIKATGGNDRDEAGLAALYRVATDSSIKWRPNAQKVVVVFGDQPQHEPTCVSGRVINRADVIRELRERDITLVSIDVRNLNAPPLKSFTCSKAKPSVTLPGNQMIQISVSTKGEHRKTTVLSEVIDTLNNALDNLKLQFNIDITKCSGAYEIRFNIFVPLAVMRGQKVCFDQTIKYKPAACSASVSKKCDVLFSASGPLLGTQTLLTQKIQGCPP